MTLTYIGYLLFPLSILVAFSRRSRIYWVAFSAPLSNLIVFNVDGMTWGFNWFMTLCSLLVLKKFIDQALGYEELISICKPDKAMVIFYVACALSLVATLVLEMKVQVVPIHTPFADFKYLEYIAQPLKMRMVNYTQLMYLTFMLGVYLALRDELVKIHLNPKILMAFVWSAGLVLVSGLIYQLCLSFGFISFVQKSYVFFTGHEELMMQWKGGFAGIPRMYSLAGEASGTSVIFLISFVFVLMFFHPDYYRWDKKNLAIVFIIGVFISGGTSGYVGLAILLSLLLLLCLSNLATGHFCRSLIVSNRYYLVALLAFIAVCIALSFVEVREVASYHLNKIIAEPSKSSSGEIRAATIQAGIDVFLQSPLIGVGIGSHRTTSLISSLLANTGVVGAGSFLYAMYVLLKGRANRASLPGDSTFVLKSVMWIAFIPALVVALISSGTMVLVSGWFLLIIAALGAWQAYEIDPKQAVL